MTITKHTVEALESLARAGDDRAVRKLLFDTLDSVRGEPGQQRTT
jgi:hypothetical protein